MSLELVSDDQLHVLRAREAVKLDTAGALEALRAKVQILEIDHEFLRRAVRDLQESVRVKQCR